jgi:diguanylate cyclase (GGDEF)-like protein/PAS domain S-box-containing protein
MMVWSAAWVLGAAVACAGLLRRGSGQPEGSVKNGYRWLAVAAVCLAVGATAQQAFGGLAGGASPLRLGDLISLAALPAIVIGMATLTSGFARGEHGRNAGVRSAGAPRGIALDSCLLVGALFVMFLVTLFGPDYVGAHIGRAAFALDLIRPVLDMIALGLVLRFFGRNVGLTLLPALALLAVIVADSLAVGDRVAGRVPGLGTQVALTTALVLLALASVRSAGSGVSGGPRMTRFARPRGSWSSPATAVALSAAAAAAIVITGYAVGGGPILAVPLAAAGTVVVLLLVIRLAGLTRQASAVAEAAQESDWMFRALADTASDAVLICDLAGTIEYASRGVAEFGYDRRELTGVCLAEIVHPEDRPAGIRAAIAALRSRAGTATFAGRVRGADGSWRHVESTLSRYGAAGEPARLLITSRDVSDRIALRRQLTQLTFHDGLTGLPNRAYVEERVKDLASGSELGSDRSPPGTDRRAVAMDGIEAQPLVGAILVDFDGYAVVNEVAGHAGGDLVLAQAGRRLRAAVPPTATVARWGGDEFAVLLGPDVHDQDVIDLAERLAGLIAAEPFRVAAKQIALTASVGAAVSRIGEAAQVIANAEIALASAQEAGVGRVEIFAAAMRAEADRRLELTADLGRAIAEQRLDIEYLPVVELASSQIRGVEAVSRWCRDDEQIPPAEFLAVAEASGQIVQLGGWLLRRACFQVAAWRRAGLAIGLSVACTARQATEPGFVSAVLSALEEAELPPEVLTLQVAERVVTGSAPSVAAELARLRGKGIRLALDSFGTGMMSLASLRRSAVDVIRIDRSCIAGLDSDPALEALTKTIIQLGQDLGIEVIADGVERPEQRWRLEAMGCVLGQGPALAPPMTSAEHESEPAGQAEDAACTAS